MRVSSRGDRDPDKWLTVPMQRDAIIAYCEQGGHTLTDLRSDIDVSGGSDDRPNLEQLVAQIETGQLEGLVVAKLDRFARNLAYGVKVIERIDEAGGVFVATADGFDLRTDAGRLQLHIMLSFADYELRRFRTGWRQARERIIERGQHWGPSVPLGYRRRDDGILEPDPVTGPIAREMFARRAGGEGVSDLARWLDSLGIRTARGGEPGRRWVNDMIKRRVYLGEAYAGELRNTDAHEALIDRVTWERAQRARGARPARATEPTLFGGLIRCHGCRYVMGANWSELADGRKRAYRCRVKQTGGDCPRPAFALEDQLTPIIEAALWDALDRLDLAAKTTAAEEAGRYEILDLEVQAAQAALAAYRDEPAIFESLSPREYADGLTVRKQRVTDAEAARASVLAMVPLPVMAANLRDDWERIPVEVKRAILHQLIGTVVVQAPERKRDHSIPLRDRTRILAPGTLPDDLPVPGRNPVDTRSFPDFDDPACPWML